MRKSYDKAYTPTNGVRTDFKRLMNLFLSSATVRFEKFSEVWRALNMSYLCAGRNTDREAREFIEKVLVIAREYFLPPYQFQVRVGGLYLLYAVYQIQPISPKAKIRLTSSHWDDALHFQQQAKLQSHLDVVYIFNRLIQEQAFHFCFTHQEIGTQLNAWESEDAEVDLADEMKEEKCIINKLFNYESLEQLSYLQDQYQRMKIALAGPHATKPDKSLNVVKEELVEDIVLSLQTFKENVAKMSKRVGNSRQTEASESNTEPETVGSRRQALKNQAYAGSVSTRKRGLSSSTASPDKNLAIDRANRAAQRALSKSKGDGDSDADWTMSDVSLASPTRLQISGSPEANVDTKNLSMPSVVSDNEVSSGDGSDEDYVPIPKRARGRPCRQKVASRKNQQLKKSVLSSPPLSKTENTSSTKHPTTKLGKSRISAKNSQSSTKPHPSKKDSFKDCVAKTGLNHNTNAEKSGFRIKWTPVINLRNSDSILTKGSKGRKGSPPKYVQAFIDNMEALNKKKHILEISDSDDNSDSEIAQPSFKCPKNVKQVSSSSNGTARIEKTKTIKESVLRGVNQRENATSPKTNSKNNFTALQQQQKGKKKSTYEVFMAPTARKNRSNIFDNNAGDGNPSLKRNAQSNSSHSQSTAIGENNLRFSSPPLNPAENGTNILREILPHSQSTETSNPDPAKNNGQQNVQIAKKCIRETKDKTESSYKIVFAPTASQSYADMGDNANALPLQLKFPLAQYSHSMPGKVKIPGQQNQPLFSKGLATADNPDASKDSNSKSNIAQTTNEGGSTSSDQNECEQNIKSSRSSVQEKVKKGSFEKNQPSDKHADSGDVDQSECPKGKPLFYPRKSKYYNVPPHFTQCTAQKSALTVLSQKNLDKAFNNLTDSKKVQLIKPESQTLQRMREFREKLEAKKSQKTVNVTDEANKDQKSGKSSKVVVDCFKFL